jgi:hypothetical protein
MNEDKQFNLMMSKAHEIKWEPKVGDWTDKGVVVFIHMEGRITTTSINNKHLWHQKEELIYLPTIEQLMGMVIYEGTDVFIAFHHWLTTEYLGHWQDSDTSTGRCLWLAFVMWELYQKVWRNNQWVKTVA